MIAGVLTVLSFAALFFFPWPLTALIALAAGMYEPLVPFAVGISSDLFYYAPASAAYPRGTVLGLLATIGIYIVRSRLRTGSIER